jgi:hypothetical protein
MENTNLQVLTALKAGIDSQIVGLQGQSTALADAIALETNGYQSDQDAIAQQVSDGISAALSPVSDAVSAALSKVSNEKTSSQVASL